MPAISDRPWVIRNEAALGTLAPSTNDGTLVDTNCDATYHGADLG